MHQINNLISVSPVVFGKKEEQALIRVLRSGNIVQGAETGEFEKEFERYIGSDYAVAVASGTAALHAALLALGIGAGDEVITTPFSFIATANAILYTGARPVFVDVGEDGNIDVSLIASAVTSKTKAIMPVHLYGVPCEMNAIRALARKHKLFVVEDACQAHGATYQGKAVGSLGKVACFSFYATKNVRAGEGGMITTNSGKIAERLRLIRSHGATVRYHHTMLGYNYRMTDLAAAIGRVQLAKLDSTLKKRKKNFKYYSKHLSGIPGLIVPAIEVHDQSACHHYTLRIGNNAKISRDISQKLLRKKRIETAIHYPVPIHKQPSMKRYAFGSFPIAERLSRKVLSIPAHEHLSAKQRSYVAQAIRSLF